MNAHTYKDTRSSEESWGNAIPLLMMDPKLTWSILLLCLTVRVISDSHLLQEVALLANEDNPKCFTSDLSDFTCFWEALEGKSYEFFYRTDEEETRCNISEQESKDGTILHVCFFPAEDIFLFIPAEVRVVDTHTNTTIYNRSIDVEKQLLLDPPSNLSLHLTGEAGELLVKWQAPKRYLTYMQYEIRYFSNSQDTVILVKTPSCEYKLRSLVPGDSYTVQMRLQPNGTSFAGHWSDWSSPVTAMVPQPADDIELQCCTPDLHQVQCRWNEGRYGYGNYSLHYRQTNRSTWGSWTVCSPASASGKQCVFYGEESTMFKVYLRAGLCRTFYMDTFMMSNSIKTKAPEGLKEERDGERHCLRWDCPLPLISQHLIYQVRYQVQGESVWKLFTVLSPKTSTCLDVQVGSQYSVQVKAMPNGSLYGGHWSAWSKSLTIQLPSNTVPLDPPSNLSLHLTGEAGQLLVKWQAPKRYLLYLQYEIRYFSNSQDTVILVKTPSCEHKLRSLVPGDSYTVQMRLQPNGTGFGGHWSDWSSPVTAMVPQPADDIELQCCTPDLHQVQCRWNEGRYGYGNYSLHYRQTNRSTWGSWTVCSPASASGKQCVFYGEESTMFKVYLRAGLCRTFYMDTFMMSNSIKTKAPEGLKEERDGERHCLRWDCPLPLISQHLIYQVRYQVQGESVWKFFTVLSPKTSTCLDVQVGSQYSVQVKAMPNGSLYGGHWSAWSKSLTIQLPSNTGLLFIACVPFILLIICVMMFSFFSSYVSKLKQFLWPPVPNLNEVLESFLKDINGQHWEPNFSTKLCDEDIPASVVEIMSEGDAHVMRKPPNCPHYTQPGSLAWDNNGECSVDGLEVNREYVTLNSDGVLPCLAGNDYVYKMNSSSGQVGEKLCCRSSDYYTTFSTSTNDILNHSYVQAEDGGAQTPDRHYTNLENTATTTKTE